MEDEVLPSPCPVCNREVIGSFASHLQLHSKQDLIYTIINQHDALGLFRPVKSTSSQNIIDDIRNEESRNHDHGLRSTSPPKKSYHKGFSRRRSSGVVTGGRDLPHQQPNLLNSINNGSQSGSESLPHGSKLEIIPIPTNHTEYDENRTLMLEVALGADGNIEPETTEIMPIQICSFISNPSTDDRPNDPNPELQTLYPIDTIHDDNGLPHSNFIQYIIEGPASGADIHQQELTKWILPGGRSVPVYSSFTQIASIHLEDPLSLDGENSSSFSHGKTLLSTQQNDMDLMTDEEIPPRGEISEYEESNTSSHQSDELNKPGIMNIGSTLGSLFSDARRLVIEADSSSKDRSMQSKKKCKIIPDIASSSILATKSSVDVDRHKCPDPDCSQVGSIFELAQHQEKVHERKYKIVKLRENSSQSSSRQAEKTPIVNHVPKSVSGYRCLYCEYNSDKPKFLQGHMEQCHPGKPLNPEEFECRTCGKIFQKRTNLNKHLLIHGIKKFPCHCGKAFTSGFKLMEHGRVHTKDYPFECLHCERHFRTPSLLKTHILRIHPQPGDAKPVLSKKVELFCNICSRILHSKRSFTKHQELHAEKAQKCPICYETFPRNGILTRHIRIAHDSTYETKESKDCPVCFKKMHPNSLKSHMRIHNQEKPFGCPVCSKSFRTSANLTSHSWSHTNAEKPFKCSLCPKSYLFKNCLEAHLIVHKKRRFHFVCNECGMKFTSKVNLKRHCDEHFSEKKYKCNLCFKKFHRKYYLVEHVRIHNGSKPYTCTICGKGSTTRSNHRAHIKIHDARESGTQEG